jgi:hypothetical protein
VTDPTQPVPGPTREPEVVRVAMSICRPCLDGVGQECHTPGCALWMHKVDLPIGPEFYELLPARPSPTDDDRERQRLSARIAELEGVIERLRGQNTALGVRIQQGWAEIERRRAHQGTA